MHAGCAGGLNAVDLDVGSHGLDGTGNACDEAAAADGDDDCVHVVHLVHDLHADGALSGDDVFVIKGMDEGVTHFVPELQRLVVGVVVNAFDQADLCAVALGGLHLGDGGGVGQADQGGDAALAGGQRHALGVVAGGTGDDALGPLLNGELGDHVACAPELEGAGVLKIFGLQIQVTVGGDARRLGQGGGADDILQNHGSVEDLVDGHHSDLSFIKTALSLCIKRQGFQTNKPCGTTLLAIPGG